jgi:general secretion pathway protein E
MAGVTQIQTHASIGLGFAEVLRSVLRQDPDIIMIGEIRDLETAKIAVQAALTGHLVLATLHTNSAAAAINRLRDMGIPDYLLATTLRGAVAQRLVRKLCPACAEDDPGASSISELAGRPLAGKGFKRAVGCEACGSNGYRGRLALLEVLTLSPAVHDLLLRQADETALTEAAKAEGMRDLTSHGFERAEQGETSIAEVMRVVSIR